MPPSGPCTAGPPPKLAEPQQADLQAGPAGLRARIVAGLQAHEASAAAIRRLGFVADELVHEGLVAAVRVGAGHSPSPNAMAHVLGALRAAVGCLLEEQQQLGGRGARMGVQEARELLTRRFCRLAARRPAGHGRSTHPDTPPPAACTPKRERSRSPMRRVSQARTHAQVPPGRRGRTPPARPHATPPQRTTPPHEQPTPVQLAGRTNERLSKAIHAMKEAPAKHTGGAHALLALLEFGSVEPYTKQWGTASAPPSHLDIQMTILARHIPSGSPDMLDLPALLRQAISGNVGATARLAHTCCFLNYVRRAPHTDRGALSNSVNMLLKAACNAFFSAD